MDYNKLINYCFVDWLKDKKMQKYFAMLIITYLIIGIISIYQTMNYFGGINETNPEIIFQLLFKYTIEIVLLTIPFSILIILINYFVISNALKLSNKKSLPITLKRGIKFLFYSLVSTIFAIFSLFNLKFLLILIIGIILGIVGIFLLISPLSIIGALLIGLSILFILIYSLIIIYNSIRLIIGEAIFVEKEESLINSLKKSWDLTTGKLIEIFITIIIATIILIVISFLGQIPSAIYSTIWSFSNTSLKMSEINQLSIMSDPIFIILMIPIYLISAYSIIVGNLLLVYIYTQITKKK